MPPRDCDCAGLRVGAVARMLGSPGAALDREDYAERIDLPGGSRDRCARSALRVSRPGRWWAAFEIGPLAYATPIFGYAGGYLQLAPIDMLVLRFEVSGVGYWTLPIRGAGYYALPSADAPRDTASLPIEAAQSASGTSVDVSATFRGRVPIDPHAHAIALADTLALEHIALGSGPYFIGLRSDLTQARDDIVLANDALVAVEVVLNAGTRLRVGVSDSVRTALATGAVLTALRLPSPETWPISWWKRESFRSSTACSNVPRFP